MEQLDYLDPKTKLGVVNLLLELNQDGKTTAMMTHDKNLYMILIVLTKI